PTVFSFALTIDSDARVLAHLAQFEGVRAIDVISGDTPLMKRFAAAFASEWIAGGGRLPSDLRFDPAPESLTLLRRNLVRAAPAAAPPVRRRYGTHRAERRADVRARRPARGLSRWATRSARRHAALTCVQSTQARVPSRWPRSF